VHKDLVAADLIDSAIKSEFSQVNLSPFFKVSAI